MCGKNKCICAALVMVLLCLLSACTVDGNGTDNELRKENASAEHESGSEGLPPETDAGSQAAENTGGEQSGRTADNQEEDISSGMEERYKAILLGEEDFVNIDHRDEDRRLNIENIKEAFSDDDWAMAKVTEFTIIDLDGNGENEVVLRVLSAGASLYGYEILYYQDQEVYGFTLPAGEFMHLKTDGTFDTFGGIEDSEDDFGTGRLRFSERGYKIEDASDSGSQVRKTDAGWYELTPESVELAFENFENISSGMEERYKAILLGEEDFVIINYRSGDRRLNIENIKEVVSEDDWVTAKVTEFTIIDLDGNGENEMVLRILANGDSLYGYEILFYQDQEVYGFTLWARAFMDLKKDGTFDYSGGIENSGTGRLQLFKKGYAIEEIPEDSEEQNFQDDKPDAEWYELTPESVELAFENKF